LIGPKRAKELLLTGSDEVTAERALAMGLINRVVPAEDCQAEALRIARTIAVNDSVAVTLTKKAINRSYEAMGMRQALLQALELDVSIEASETPESREFDRIMAEQGTKAALAWQQAFDAHYADPDTGGYYLSADDATDLLLRPHSTTDDATRFSTHLARLMYECSAIVFTIGKGVPTATYAGGDGGDGGDDDEDDDMNLYRLHRPHRHNRVAVDPMILVTPSWSSTSLHVQNGGAMHENESIVGDDHYYHHHHHHRHEMDPALPVPLPFSSPPTQSLFF